MSELRLRVETGALAQGLEKVKGALGKRDGIQALTYILFNVGAEGITLTAYNQAIAARAKVATPPDSFGGKTFGFCMDGRFALAMSGSAKGEIFEMVFTEEDIAKQGQNASFYAKVACGDAEWTPLCIPESSYPLVTIPSQEGYTVTRTALQEALDKVVPSMTDIARGLGESQDAAVKNSFGLHFRDGFLEAGGFGRYSIGKIQGVQVTNYNVGLNPADHLKFNFVLPPEGAQALQQIVRLSASDTVMFGVTEDKQVVFQFGSDTLGIYCSENYWLDLASKLESPVEVSKKELFAVDRVLFAGAIEQVQFLSEGEHGVRLQKNGNNLLIYGDDEVGQKGKVLVRVQWKTADDYVAAFNWEFLKGIARTFGSEQERLIVFKEGLTAAKKPILFVESASLKTFIIPAKGLSGPAPTPPSAVPATV